MILIYIRKLFSLPLKLRDVESGVVCSIKGKKGLYLVGVREPKTHRERLIYCLSSKEWLSLRNDSIVYLEVV